MRYWCICCVCSAALFAQSSNRTENTAAGVDVNGRSVNGSSYASVNGKGFSERTEYTTNLNGSKVPRETVEERIVSQTGGTVVTERTVRRYDANGRPGPAEKTRIEETKRPDGSGTRNVTTYRSDLNGNMQLAEQAISQATVSGNTTNIATQVQRATLNGNLELVERQAEVRRQTTPGTAQEESITYRRDTSGQFVPAVKEVRDRTSKDGQTVENTSTYDNRAGALSLVSQSVSRTTSAADGSQTTVSDLYTTAVPGRAGDAYAGQAALREEQVTERRKNADGSFSESTISKRPNPRDPRQFESTQKIREVICKGDCAPKP